VKNRSRSEFRKRDIRLRVDLGTGKGRVLVASLGVFEIVQNMELLEVIERQTYEIEKMLMRSSWIYRVIDPASTAVAREPLT